MITEGAKAAQAAGGNRLRQIETVFDEVAAVRHRVARANPRRHRRLCDRPHAKVVAELETITHAAQAGARATERPGTRTGGRRLRRGWGLTVSAGRVPVVPFDVTGISCRAPDQVSWSTSAPDSTITANPSPARIRHRVNVEPGAQVGIGHAALPQSIQLRSAEVASRDADLEARVISSTPSPQPPPAQVWRSAPTWTPTPPGRCIEISDCHPDREHRGILTRHDFHGEGNYTLNPDTPGPN